MPRGFLWDFRTDAMGILWYSYGIYMGFLVGILYGISLMFLWDFFGITMGFLWHSYESSMMFL